MLYWKVPSLLLDGVKNNEQRNIDKQRSKLASGSSLSGQTELTTLS